MVRIFQNVKKTLDLRKSTTRLCFDILYTKYVNVDILNGEQNRMHEKSDEKNVQIC